MKKQFEAAFLLAGTAIGSGMISLPIVLAKFGILGSILIMLTFSVLTYATALIRADLNLQTKSKATLGEIGKFFACSKVGALGDFCLQLLSFALMSAYLFGGTSILAACCNIPTSVMTFLFSIVIAIAFFLSFGLILKINKILFTSMFTILVVQVILLLSKIDIEFIPIANNRIHLQDWSVLIPIVFTSFGFQGSIHSVTKFCNNDRNVIKNACLWGSIIPAIVYIIWTVAVLLVIANTDANFFRSMLSGQSIDVGELVETLSCASSMKFIQLIIKIVSFLAVLTSIFGVGIALFETLNRNYNTSKLATVSMTVFLPAIVALLIPNAFIRILKFSGIILSIIAIIVPIIISIKMQKLRIKRKTKLLLANKGIMFAVFAFGLIIILLGCFERI